MCVYVRVCARVRTQRLEDVCLKLEGLGKLILVVTCSRKFAPQVFCAKLEAAALLDQQRLRKRHVRST
jgi:hypothetical protein